MQQNRLIILIDKWLNQRASKEEEKQLTNWYNDFESKEQFTDKLTEEEEKLLGDKMLGNILLEIRKDSKKKPIRHIGFSKSVMKFAAGLSALLLCVSLLLNLFTSDIVEIKTAYNETKTIQLPDNSEVILNGNSSIHYNASWQSENDTREVWLDGEAFFSVTHKTNNQNFKVHISDTSFIEVLGTEFNVSDRKGFSEIALKSGSIRLAINKSQNDVDALQTNDENSIMMSPGDVVQIEKNKLITISKERERNRDVYYAWTEQKLLLDNTKLSDIISKLSDNSGSFGLKIKLKQKDLGERKASGSIPLSANTLQLLENIAILYEVELKLQDGEYTFK